MRRLACNGIVHLPLPFSVSFCELNSKNQQDRAPSRAGSRRILLRSLMFMATFITVREPPFWFIRYPRMVSCNLYRTFIHFPLGIDLEWLWTYSALEGAVFSRFGSCWVPRLSMSFQPRLRSAREVPDSDSASREWTSRTFLAITTLRSTISDTDRRRTCGAAKLLATARLLALNPR